jgi:hypothetical protein
MAFITAADISPFIKEDQLDVLLGDNYANLEPYINATQVEFESYLSTKFDTTTIFAQEGAQRNSLLVKYFVDCVIFNLWTSIAPNTVPEARKFTWDAALKWLKMAAKGEVTPDLPLRQIANQNPPETIGYKRSSQRDFDV